MIKIKRVYEPAEPSDGERFLVDRFWPRGMKKDSLSMQAWVKAAAPSTDLIRWFGHDPARRDEFQQRYRAELDANPSAWQPLAEAARRGDVTLLYSARDTQNNQAAVLKGYLEDQLGG